jgi:hypothetical protein
LSARHRTLEATLEWSYDRLPPALQEQFVRLAVFRGEFDLDAAVAVTGGQRNQALAGVAQLVAKSLVDVRRTDVGAAYRLLFVPRAFGEERLRSAPYEQDARRSHAHVVLNWLRDRETAWAGGPQFAAWLANYGPVAEDLRAALEWALSQRGELELACNLAHDGALAWFRLSLLYDGARYVDEALKQLELLEVRDLPLELKLMTVRGALLQFTAHAAQAGLPELDPTTFQNADRTTLQIILWARWLRASRTCRYRAALGFARQFHAVSDPAELADQLAAERMIAVSCWGLGRLEEARRGLERVIGASAGGAPYSAATRFQFEQTSVSLARLAQIHWMQGDFEAAKGAASRAFDAAERTGHGLSIAFALAWGVVQTAILTGDADAAEAAFARWGPYETVIENVQLPGTNALRAAALTLRGRQAEAAVFARRFFGEDWLETAFYSALLGRMCEILGRSGEPEQGLSHIDTALDRFGQEPEDCALPELRRAKAALLMMAHGDAAQTEALAVLDQALAQARSQGSRTIEVAILTERARLFEVGGA